MPWSYILLFLSSFMDRTEKKCFMHYFFRPCSMDHMPAALFFILRSFYQKEKPAWMVAGFSLLIIQM
ncbi:hypothetical protein BSK33_04990 [Geobacillus sp. 44B]|nr:hypothetical protein BSK33_04990 [Geobacillus sp. 44B]